MTRPLHSDYMHFAKYSTGAGFNLATSGVMDCDIAELGLQWDDLALHGPNVGGYDPLAAIVADRFRIDPACVVMAGGGASFANHLAMAAILAPGDEVLAESPTYELLTSTLGYLGATVRRFERRLDEDWRLDPARIAAAIAPATRLVVLTNLHNPSGALADDAEVRAVAEAAAAVGASVLVDEVYRELLFGDGPATTSFAPDGNTVVTSSLTKAYGLSGLRCGWILAAAPLAERMRRLNDLFGVHPPHISERMAVVAFERLPQIRARAEAILEENRAAYRALLGRCPTLDQRIFEHGTTIFPRLAAGDGDALFQRLMAEFETSVVPGRFFGLPEHFRVGLGGDPAATRAGLEQLARALG